VGTAEILDTNVTGAKLNDDAISGQGALGAEPADTDEFLVSDAGVLKRVDYSHIKATPGITQANFLPYANPVLINGNMAIAQRATSETGVTGNKYVCDRYQTRVSSAGTWTITQEALSADEAYEDGFATASKMDCTTANASLAVGAYMRFHYAIEAQDCQLFKLGNAGSDTLTLAFWVKATKTGTNVATMIQTDPDRMCCQSYTVDTTNTWEHKVLNFPADTAGAGINDDTGEGLEIDFHMAAGTNFTSGTLQTTWAARVNADRAVGQVNHADSTSNNFHITGIQLEAGTYTSADLPPFRHESYGDNLRRCQRYYERLGSGFSGGSNGAGNNVDGSIAFSVAKRSTGYSGSLQATSSVIAKPAIAGYNLSSLYAVGVKGYYGCYMSLTPDGSVATETYFTSFETDWFNIDDEL